VSRLLAALGACAAVLAPGASAAAGDRVIDLRGLGFGDQVFGPTKRPAAERDFAFRLPRGAKQGSDTWYLIRLHFRLSVMPASGSGRLYVVASTDGRPCALVRFDVRRTASGLRVRSSELGLVRGARRASGRSLVRETRFENFLQFAGVRGGRNVLTLKIEQYDGARMRSLRFFADSGIVVSHRGPAALALEPLLRSRTVEAGRTFKLDFRLRNTGERPAEGATVRVLAAPGLAIRGARSRTVGAVGPKTYAGGTFELEPQRAGRFAITLVASSVFGSPRARLEVQAAPARGGSHRALVAAAAGAALLVAAAGVLVLRRRRA
jgi:hypothetical protein